MNLYVSSQSVRSTGNNQGLQLATEVGAGGGGGGGEPLVIRK